VNQASYFVTLRDYFAFFLPPFSKTLSIMKHLLLLLGFIGSLSFLQAQYYVLPYTDIGRNPGGLNQDEELAAGSGLDASWEVIHPGGASSPQWTQEYTMPFPFQFNGQSEFFYKVSTSGVLTFSTSASAVPSGNNDVLPSAEIPDKSIMVWGLKGGSANDKIVRKVFGSLPNRQLWIMFNGYEYEGGIPICNLYWSIVLEEGTSNIYIVDQRGSVISSCAAGLTAGVQIDANTAFMVDGSPNLNNLAGTSAGQDDNSYYAFLPGTQPRNDLEGIKIDIPQAIPLANAPVQIKGNFLNIGSEPLQSFDLYYSVNGDTSEVDHVAGQIGSLELTHNIPWVPTSTGSYDIEMWAELPNGEADANPANNKVSMTVEVLGEFPDRTALVESFTQWNCGPCAAQNPALDALLHNNPLDATAVKFVGWWPGANNDERHLFNVADNTARINYYGVNGVPTTIFGGTWEGQPGGVSQGMINAENDRPGLYNIDISETVNGSNIDVSVTATAIQDIPASNDLTLQIAVIQDERIYTSPPGSNGETEFYHTMRYMLPDASGTPIGRTGGASVTVTDIAPIVQRFYKSFMNVVVWVQDDVTQEIYMSTKSKGIYICADGTPIQPIVATVEASCGNSDGEASISLSGGTAPYSFLWSTGETSANISGKPADDYEVTVTDNNGCTFDMNIRIKEKPAPNLVLSVVPITCKDAADARVVPYVGGGDGPFTYSWSTGSTDPEIEDLDEGIYTLTLTDANGCQVVESVLVEEPDALSATASALTTDNGTASGSATAMASGGTHPYTYSWNSTPAQTGMMATDLTFGDYQVTVTDYYGCQTVQTVTIDNTTSIGDLLGTGIAALELYPNPSRGQVSLSLQLEQADEVQLSLLDAAGRTVLAEALGRIKQYEKTWNLGHLPAGVYVLQVRSSEGTGLRRLIIE